ncbi:30S ribosomal protein S17 (plastid) [Chondrus crispus]|uniref:Small ribosomal subunit protein uS17c n=1 Tax=Chondrus crispus TaxID=2769 RepID=M5DES0_CHOCR|nr:30S ribosomal protein S17 [Chondrus crispus]CCP38126.1 30S ribosomal protein S17 [Chondrus crispus]|eukprot:YP_007627379.1 30S ribosomal protein S17 (plastid) [Chondrus crispus]
MAIKETIGKVTSDKMHKTITVAVTKKVAHKKYNKIIIKTNKYYAHDEKNECKRGDVVKIQETRPISKNKRWKLISKITK